MGIRDINTLKGATMHETQEPESTPLDPKPDPDPVEEVNDDELDTLEPEGESDVREMSPEEAGEDPTVDNEENDTPPATQPTQGQGADPGVSS
jgi:hypothetical protein